MRKVFIALAATFPLMGCASAEQLAKQDGAKCQGFGYVEGSVNFADCMRKQAEIRAYARAYARAIMAQALANTGQMYQQRVTATAAAPAPAMQTCHTILDPNLGTATTHCY